MSDVRIFRYGALAYWAPILFMATLVLSIYVFIGAFDTNPQDDLIYIALALLVAPAVTLFIVLWYRDVVISSEGIGRSLLGTRSRLIPWSEIRIVQCGVLSYPDRTVKSYRLKTSSSARSGGVWVMSMIDNVDELVARIDGEVAKRRIPVTAWDVNKRIPLSSLPRPTKGIAAWE